MTLTEGESIVRKKESKQERFVRLFGERERAARAKLDVDGSCLKCGSLSFEETLVSPYYQNTRKCAQCGEVIKRPLGMTNPRHEGVY